MYITKFYFLHVETTISQLELASTPVSPLVTESPHNLRQPETTTAKSSGSVKRLSAFFEALDKQQPGTEERYVCSNWLHL